MKDEYPKVEAFLKENNMTLDEGVEYFKKRLEKLLE